MTGKDKRAEGIILVLLGTPVVIWLGLIFAPYLESGLIEFILEIGKGNAESLTVTLCSESFKSVVLFLLLYAFGIALYFSTRKNYRRGEEHGSAKWGSAKALDRKYRQKPLSANLLLTQNVRLGLDGKKHRRNLNVMVIGGSGAGKQDLTAFQTLCRRIRRLSFWILRERFCGSQDICLRRRGMR